MRQTLKQKREAKESRLVKKLYEQIKDETILQDGEKVGLKILRDNPNGKSGCKRWMINGKVIRIIIDFELSAITTRIRTGYKDDYYEGRADKINPFILGNRHNAIRFILYHELKHAKDRLIDLSQGSSEKLADDWAIAHLTRR